MKNQTKGLIALNAALLGVLGVITLSPGTVAQNVNRARGEYTMVSGRVVGGGSNAVYIFDASNQDMVALLWNQTSKGLDGIGYRDLRADAQLQPGR